MRDMREILFRGKRKDNGEWIYGALLSFPEGKPFIATKETIMRGKYGLNDIFTCSEEIIPETRGQYTGLTDKNGVKIFEGDIIAGKGSQAKKDHFVIRWNEASCGFSAGEGKRVWPNLNQATVSAYAVIGNIHDSPELLEGGQET